LGVETIARAVPSRPIWAEFKENTPNHIKRKWQEMNAVESAAYFVKSPVMG